MAVIYKSPTPIPADAKGPSVFLAGSIDMGAAEDWQSQMEHALADLDAMIFNPRRPDWDASWEQSITNAQFRQQVEWELDGLERATVVAMCFTADSQAPITLLELGLCARSQKLVVYCPHGYWRRGNVEVVCDHYGLALVSSFEELIEEVRLRLGA
ncbi:MAG: hypothetical protein GC159_19770 [Phycisphaera sp.]|nr:hypothetical protein [Phycisphaera sp.]